MNGSRGDGVAAMFLKREFPVSIDCESLFAALPHYEFNESGADEHIPRGLEAVNELFGRMRRAGGNCTSVGLTD